MTKQAKPGCRNSAFTAGFLAVIFAGAPLSSLAHSYQPPVVTHTAQPLSSHSLSTSNQPSSASGKHLHHQSSGNSLAGIDLKSPSELRNFFGLTGVLSSSPSTPHSHPLSSSHSSTPLNHHLSSSADALSTDSKISDSENLNLASTKLVRSDLSSSVVITIGGSSLTVNPGDRVTPAELVAASQALAGSQTLIVDAHGVATGGSLTITPQNASIISILDVPQGVTLNAQGFTTAKPLVDLGSAKILGNLDFIPSGSSSVNNSSSVADLSVSRNLLVASSASISDNGTLDISSRSLNNSGSISASSLDLITTSGSVTNSGTISATAGNVSFQTRSSTNLSINNAGGQILASNSINVRDSAYSGTANTTITGGNLLATNSVNLNGGKGLVTLNVNNLTGSLVTTAVGAHITTNAPLLALGSTNVSGDPTFYNTGGDVTVGALSFPGQTLAIVANGTILGSTINTSSAAGGGAITLIAGANFTSSSKNSSGNPANSGNTLTVTGASVNGGGINVSSINSSSSDGKGGNVTLIAYNGTYTGARGGNVVFDSITAGGSGKNVNGNVAVIAGDQNTNSWVSIGINGATTINTTGGTGGGGNVSLSTATPKIVGASVVINSSGVVTSGSFTPGALQAPSINNSNNGAYIDVTASGNVTLNTTTVYSGTVVAGGNVNINTNVVNTGSFTYAGKDSISADRGAGQLNINASSAINSDSNGNVVSISGPILASVANISVPKNLQDSQSQYDLGVITATADAKSNLLNQAVFINGTKVDNINVSAGNSVQESYRFSQGAGTISINLGSTRASGFTGQQLSLAPVVGVTINQSWLNANGGPNGPYLLTTPHSLYTLATNITVPGTAIVDAAACVTLNLNGYTVTYNNVSSPVVTNGTFSQGSGTNVPGWNISGAPSAVLAPNTYYMPGGSNQVLVLNNYSTTQTIVSNAISLTESGHTYTAEITPSNVNTNSTVSLAVIDANTDAVLGTSNSPNAARGFSAVVTFTANGDPVKLQVTVTPQSGQSDSVALGYAMVTPSFDFGVMATTMWVGQLPNAPNLPANVLNAYPKASFFTLENGSVVQGGNGANSTPLYFEYLAGNATVKNVSVTARGDNTTALDAAYLGGNLTVTNSTFTDHITWVFDRMDGVSQIAVGQIQGIATIDNNKLYGSPQLGITISSNNPLYPIYIENNYISQNGVVADAYGIGTESIQNFQISGNTIEPTVGRGICLDGYFSTATANGQIFNNYVIAQDGPTNESLNQNVTVAFRMRNDDNNGPPESPFLNIDIFDNTFIAIAGPAHGSTTAWAMAVSLLNDNGIMNNPGITINHNTIEAVVQSDAGYPYSAIGLEIETARGINPVVSNNAIISNNVGVGINSDYDLGAVNGIKFISNTFSIATDHGAVSNPYIAIQMATQDPTTTVNNVSFINSTFANGATPTISILGPGPNSIAIGQLLNVSAENQAGRALAGVSVTVSNGSGIAFTGTTGSNGQIDNIQLITTSYKQDASAAEDNSTINMLTNTFSSEVTATSSNPYIITASYHGLKEDKKVILSPTKPSTATFTFDSKSASKPHKGKG